MKFYSAIALALLQVASASAAAIDARNPSPDCIAAEKHEGIYSNSFSEACVKLVRLFSLSRETTMLTQLPDRSL